MRAYIHPIGGVNIYGYGVGWTVYFYVGVWRYLFDDKLNKSHVSHFYNLTIIAKFGDSSGGNNEMKQQLDKVAEFLKNAHNNDLWTYSEFDDYNFQEEMLELESWVDDNSDYLNDEFPRQYSLVVTLIKQVKDKYNLYCKEDVLEDMYPNDYNRDDEDSIALRELEILRIMDHLHD